VSGAADKMSEEVLRRLLPRVLEAANQISFRLGYQGSSTYV
jgi:DNA-binding IclR family transcriptional regulator